MKRNLLLLSSTLLLINLPVFAADSKTDSAGSKPSTKPETKAADTVQFVRTEQNTPSTKSRKMTQGESHKATTPSKTPKVTMVVPPPPKETTPDGVTFYSSQVKNVQPSPPPAASTKTPESNITVVGHGGPYAAKNLQIQRFADYLDINQGMDSAPLTMTINNSGFKWFRLLIANQVVATEKNLGGRPTGTINLTGIVGPGNNQIVVEAGGEPGSRIDWKVTTLTAAKLDKADPDEGVSGDTVRLIGKNFSSKASENKVDFSGKPATVIAAKDNELQVKVPTNAELGDNKVVATVRGIKSNAIKVKVRAIPEVTGTNLSSAPPGTHVIIYGKNFSKTPSENQVFLGDTAATVLRGDTTQLVILVPNLTSLNWVFPMGENPNMGALPIKVQVGKLISKEGGPTFTIGRQIYPGIGKDSQYEVGPGTPNPIYAPGQGPAMGAPEPNLQQ